MKNYRKLLTSMILQEKTEKKSIQNGRKFLIIKLPRILITRGTGSGKTNALLNLMNHQPGIGKIYLSIIRSI